MTMLSGACTSETGIACTDEARDSVNAIMITLTNVLLPFAELAFILCPSRKMRL